MGEPNRTEGHGGTYREPGTLVSFANIQGSLPDTGVTWGMVIDEQGNPWFIPASGYDWNQFMVRQDTGFSIPPQPRTPAMDAVYELSKYQRAKEAYDLANKAIFAANGWNRRRFYEANYDGSGEGYVPLDWKSEKPLRIFGTSGSQADDGRDEVDRVRIPVSIDLARAVAQLGYYTYDGEPLAVLARVNRWSRTAYFTGFNIDPTTRFQIDIAKLSTPARLGALVTSLVTLALSIATLNIAGIVGTLASAGGIVGQSIAESEAAIAAALKAEGVIPQAVIEQARAEGVQVKSGFKPASAKKSDTVRSAATEGGDDSSKLLWIGGIGAGVLLLAGLLLD